MKTVFTSLGPGQIPNFSFGSLAKKFGNHCTDKNNLSFERNWIVGSFSTHYIYVNWKQMNYIQRSWCFRISPTQFQCVEPMQFNYIHPTEFRTETELEGNGSWPGWDSYRGQPGALVSQANSLTTPPSAQLCDTAAQNKKCLHKLKLNWT